MVVFQKRPTIALLILTLALCVLYQSLKIDEAVVGVAEVDKVETKSAANTTSTTSTDSTNCDLMPSTKVITKPMWVASFPGSGAELFRELVTVITGQPTVDGGFKGVCHDAVTCKTHWPVMNARNRFQNPVPAGNYSKSVILLIRNPRKAIPSWYNQIYEARVGADFHSRQAPERSWHRWSRRPKGVNLLTERIQQWKDMLEYWLEHSHYRVELIVPYEQLTKESSGPDLLNQVGHVLDHEMIPVSPDISCLWKYTVQEKQEMKRSNHSYEPSYTSEQQHQLLVTLTEVMERFSHLDDLVQVLKRYVSDIQNNLIIEI
jgi:hypothetical protein